MVPIEIALSALRSGVVSLHLFKIRQHSLTLGTLGTLGTLDHFSHLQDLVVARPPMVAASKPGPLDPDLYFLLNHVKPVT